MLLSNLLTVHHNVVLTMFRLEGCAVVFLKHTHTPQNISNKFIISAVGTFIAVLGYMRPMVHRLHPSRQYLTLGLKTSQHITNLDVTSSFSLSRIASVDSLIS